MLFHDVDTLATRYDLPRERVKDAIEDAFRDAQLRSPLAWLRLVAALTIAAAMVFRLLDGDPWFWAVLALVVAWTALGSRRAGKTLADHLNRGHVLR